MTMVQTVLGPVDVSELGRTLVHEHIIIGYQGDWLDPTGPMDREECIRVAVGRMRELQEHGVGTFVDPCPIEMGRDPELMAEVSRQSGMHIICSTGFYLGDQELGMGKMPVGIPYYWRVRKQEEITEFYLHEIENGIGTTGIRPGAVKIASGDPPSDLERKFIHAAAEAAKRSGLTVITHCDNSAGGDVQQEILAEHGVPLERCLIGHQGQQEPGDPAVAAFAERGSFVGVDRVGCEIICPDSQLAEHALNLINAGRHEQLCLSQDHWCYPRAPRFPYPQPNGPDDAFGVPLSVAVEQMWGRTHTYIFTSFCKRLKEMGVSEQTLDTIFIDNPRHLFGG
jgi:phosphotriesterase-related protein